MNFILFITRLSSMSSPGSCLGNTLLTNIEFAQSIALKIFQLSQLCCFYLINENLLACPLPQKHVYWFNCALLLSLSGCVRASFKKKKKFPSPPITIPSSLKNVARCIHKFVGCPPVNVTSVSSSNKSSVVVSTAYSFGLFL